MEKTSVLLTTEGTYPFFAGGVSTWCHKLVSCLNEIDFSLISIIPSPLIGYKFELPSNVKKISTIPLWDTLEPSEHLHWKAFSHIFASKINTKEKIIEERFIPVFSEIIKEILLIKKNPKTFGKNIAKMYTYFMEYDYNETLKSNKVYGIFKEKILQNLENENSFLYKQKIIPTIHEVEQSLGWIFRFFNIINTRVEKTSLTHSSAAGFCGISNVIAKIIYKSPYILTEHGVYMREQYLSEEIKKMTVFLRNFYLSLTESIVRLNYQYADIVCPVCKYNSRWEKKFGVPTQKIKVIYNGVDQDKFKPKDQDIQCHKIITVARIDHLKGIEYFIKSAQIISDAFPNLQFAVYGAVSDQKYYKKCLSLRDSLGLIEKLKFYGHVQNPEDAYHSGDIVVLPSISEAFPYSIVEAMMCGSAIVATDVGGVSEALDSFGIIVYPGDAESLANACIKLYKDKRLRKEFGEKARQKAIECFTEDKFINSHIDVYNQVLTHSPDPTK